MGTVKRLAEEVERGLRGAHPKLRKTVVSKLALAVGAMIEGQTPNTVELSNLLALETERQDMREQWLRRLWHCCRLIKRGYFITKTPSEFRKYSAS